MSFFGNIIGAGIGEAVNKITTPFTNAWIAGKQASTDKNKVDKETERDVLIEFARGDVELGKAQALLAQADASHWSTRWIRPAFCSLAFIWLGWHLWLWIYHGVPLKDVVEYLLVGIVTALFVLRPFEKNKRVGVAQPMPRK